ncbi:Rad17-domain-containing protein [Ramaria rubella]|nr:Rad17-domain-containing protein [Ramaria rubella]
MGRSYSCLFGSVWLWSTYIKATNSIATYRVEDTLYIYNMPHSRAVRSSAGKKSKSKLSTLTLDAFPSANGLTGHTPLSSTPPPSSTRDGSPTKTTKPLTSFIKPPILRSKEKGKDKISPPQVLGKNDVLEGQDLRKLLTDSAYVIFLDALWVDKYEPQREAELAVHQKKVADVRHWLIEAFEGGPTGILKKYRRIMALTGPAGTGKTTTLRVLAREMDFDIVEWRNSGDDNFSGEGDDYDRESLTKKFQTFLARASSCRPLPLLSNSASSSTTQNFPRQIILLEDLPNVLHAGTADAFHTALQDHLSSPPIVPIVCIISSAGTRGEDPDNDASGGRAWGKWGQQAFDVRSVIPPNIFNSPYFNEIQFNPIAPTLMMKALSMLLTRHSLGSKASAQPTNDIVQLISESSNGDIRSAVMALQFACVVQLPKRNKMNERSVLEVVTRREQSLALFHMLGKVLYNKRKGDPPKASASKKDREREEIRDNKICDPPALPAHLAKYSRRSSLVDVNALYADSPVDTSLFALYLHHNYTQFCDELDECAKVCEWLSWIDASGSESWQAQQNPHQFHILTLGVLHSLPSPVPRRSQKMLKPEFFDILKKTRETEGCIVDIEERLNSAIAGEAAGGRRWARNEVTLELGGILKALDTCGPGALPRTHSAFTSLSFVHPAKMSNNSRSMQELGESEEPVDESITNDISGHARSWNYSTQAKQDSGGWLEADDIQDF